MHDNAVGTRLHRDSETAEPLLHRREPVALLDPELRGAADHGDALGAGGGEEQHRDLVDAEGHEVALDLDPLEPARLGDEIGDRLAARVAAVLEGDARPHAPEDPKHAVAGGIDAHPREPDPGPRGNAGSDEEEGGGGQIPGHRYGLPRTLASAREGDSSSRALHLVSETGQHPFGVITARGVLLDPGAAAGIESREQQAGLHLRARHLQAMFDSGEPLPAPHRERRGAAGGGLDPRPHPGQRLGDPAHGPARQRFVSNQRGVERVAGEQAREQAKSGSRIPQVKGTGRPAEPLPPRAADPERPRIVRYDGDPEGAGRAQGGAGVLRLEEPGHLGLPVRDGAQHHRPVRDGLVPRHAHLARERPGRRNGPVNRPAHSDPSAPAPGEARRRESSR